jgi:hypothetical protein
VVCACTPALHPVAVQRARLRRLKLSELWLAPPAGRRRQDRIHLSRHRSRPPALPYAADERSR